MGFELELFESPVDPEFLCKLCGKVLEEPLTTPCGHVFCAGCVIPWVAKWSSCPAKCRWISAAELNRVLALKNLVLKLAVRCHNRPLGCSRVLELRHLAEHAAACGFSPVTREIKLGVRSTELRGLTVDIRGMSEVRGERDARRRAEGSCAREKRLQLAQLHRQLQSAALRNRQQDFEELRRNSSGWRRWSPVNTGEETRRHTVTLHRGSGPFGFNIIGGRSCEGLKASGDFSDGIYVSKIVENGAADRAGLQIHDRIIKVNNRELSLATHDDAVEAFLMARDPIEVEVLRRVAPTKTSSALIPDTRGVDTTTQTEISLEHVEAVTKLTSPPTPVGMSVMDKHKYQPTESEMLSYSSLYPTGFFEDMPKYPEREELEYEEVDLQKRSTQDKLGLTLCYKTDEEEETGIYVSEIDPGSIAAQDGRVREGDQIIQINGVDIQNHEEAVAVLSKGNCRNVRLLLARPEIQDDGWLEEDEHSFLEDLEMGTLEKQHCQSVHFTASMLHQREREEDEGTTDTATVLSNPHEKDSGVGRTDESTRNDESSEQENLGDDHTSTSDTLLSSGKRLSYGQDVPGGEPMHFSSESFLSADGGEFSSIPEVECERFRELLELKCLVNETSPDVMLGESARSFGKRISLDCDEQEIEMLNEELRKIELECLSIIRSHRLQQEIQRQQANRDSRELQSGTDKTSTGKGQKVYNITTDILEQMDKDSSSAYNTGESCRSSSLTLELSSSGTQDGVKDAYTNKQKPTMESTMLSPIQETSPTKNLSSFTEFEATKEGKGKEQGKDFVASPVSPSKHIGKHIANIPAHAQHYQSYMQLVQQKSAVEFGQSEVSLVSLCQNPQISSFDKPKMEWKVKIRSDGTRYITKRPAKEQLLRERALRIREERRGMTTDDDTVSELKMGRYWSKEERKQHAIRAKEQRQRREFMKQSRMAYANEQEGRADDIVQLSHKKMMKKRNKKILDSWMTIQELLTHGAKSPDGTQLQNPLLSVTTV
ncbi:E3 ubiquitin-protein ligase PDZRN3 isoform X1 [Astyanax mexicanus]|uniref:E3 ubiquitin-protein ligase PDZRN3 isoform X1 n=1 Tax=Astyanax mexicanus TaxID=7994 RepID=A0A8T2LJA2_ASTMX|nr:E3 ubiquitin-protein ligase PDZRN3 isoform X1 [Astyanax mexicanus]